MVTNWIKDFCQVWKKMEKPSKASDMKAKSSDALFLPIRIDLV